MSTIPPPSSTTSAGFLADCDQDALVVRVVPATGAVCHTGAHSDFVEGDDTTPRVVKLRG